MEIMPIHYQMSKPVKSYAEIREDADTMRDMLKNHRFKGVHDKGYAIANSEITDRPLAFFVVSEECIGEKLFEHDIFINPKIREAKIYRENNGGKVPKHLEGKVIRIPNSTDFEEPCLSFPFRNSKRMTRFDKIKVSYQIPKKILGFSFLWTVKRNLTGIASALFQHCYDHTIARNIFFPSEKVIKWWVR